ncbi:hypothetical protein OEZ86_012425 [Tetradesmus obliquus]|uniref:Fatty acid hydroxylase domain-containing protein n=1 Tax=Tetradesmus obliquus TaxID=3088 RepID=A0A383W698_TETOB|nr:hypothetical protein OEZ86_012425 [Tetradesmus obliquus]|eukprot:jgi/Sobl393_1/15766/SZX73177.1
MAGTSSSSSWLQLLHLQPLWGGGFLVALCQLSLFYYGLGAVLHWVVPLLGPVQGIQEAPRKPGEVARDAINSIGPIVVKAGIWYIVEQMHAAGISKLYAGPVSSPYQVAYLLLCIVLLDYLHDAWFYWTHRALHWRPLYRWVHWEHHRSTAPSAFTGYAFHVVEALIVFANEVLVCWLFPIHMGLHRIYHIATTVIHEAGHVGYELSPFIPTLEGIAALLGCGLRGSPGLNTVQHHDMHHRYPTKHFSLYFTHWDRWMGTLHPKYDAGLFRYFS